MKQRRFVIYPGKVSQHETFRIDSIGDLTVDDGEELLVAIHAALTALKRVATN